MPDAGTGSTGAASGAVERQAGDRVARLVRKYGSPEAAIESLLRDAKAARARARGEVPRDGAGAASLLADSELYTELQNTVAELERDNADLRKTVPPKGAVILTGDDVKLWEGFKGLGKKPEELTTVLTEHATLATFKREHEEGTTVDKAAALVGYKPGVLRRIMKSEGLVVEIKPAPVKDEDTGKTTMEDAAFVRRASEKDAKPEPLADFVERELNDFLPALAVTDDDDDDATERPTTSRSTSGARSGNGGGTGAVTTRVPAQRTGGTTAAKKGNEVATVLRSRYAVPASLRKPDDKK